MPPRWIQKCAQRVPVNLTRWPHIKSAPILLQSHNIHTSHRAWRIRPAPHSQLKQTLRRSIRQQSCTLFTDAIPPVMMPPLIFTGLLLSLWAWKCFWIVVMQEKLLYLTWLPPFARSEKIADYEGECRPVRWEEHQIRSRDGTKLAVCEGHVPPKKHGLLVSRGDEQSGNQSRRKLVIICYFQGNGGSTPMRLPLLSQILRAIHAAPASSPEEIAYIMVALSYRGFWTSSGRPTQRGIELDTQAFLDWVAESYGAPDTDLQVILWGHSLGSAIATTGLATYLARPHDNGPAASIAGVILEAPSSSVKDMLISLYPQKWLPYRYLWPFLRSHWDSILAMERMARWRDEGEVGSSGLGNDDGSVMLPSRASLPPILILSAENDEVIPPHAADDLEQVGRRLGLSVTRKHVAGALHTEAPVKADGKKTMVDFICQCTLSGTASEGKVRPKW
ncbi:alpha/beta-hydrolase [Aspergillus sclerotioniger CBS 115572]|uniref:Alpha/beta-hydrolase n=1 Tax=Aspergillus sclerotioniger CBS 115572 TaxID=1450535 RepID=A0A317W8U5_9EURO|nr:alpha/beta-hydrolase [Aspergillus sclerotioniger CBS 115572]PWY81727.1 alpha/beta-hydrolase [Aspergillus sclerotioniger CBS 115572]